MLYKYVSFLFLIIVTQALMPKKLPNGKIVRFIANLKHPECDLKVITPGSASIISRNWLENIVVDVVAKENNKLKNNVFSNQNIFEYEDLHIVTGINKLEGYIQETYQANKDNIKDEKKNIFLAWSPKGMHGRTEVLFLIVAQIHVLRKEFIIRHLIQSPFWDPAQIDSSELKKALIAQNTINNCTTINLDYLYENDLRYKLAWAVWELNMTTKRE